MKRFLPRDHELGIFQRPKEEDNDSHALQNFGEVWFEFAPQSAVT